MNHPLKRPIHRPFAALLALLLACTGPAAAQALTPAFTYQGELRLSSGPANGSFDMQFRLYDAQSGGSQIGATLTSTNLPVAGGLFAVPLDFGPAQFAGDRQWLEIAIRPAGSGSYETLSPRTEVTATPYAWSAAVALADSVTTTSIVDGTIGSADINAAQIQRRVTGTCPAGQYVRVIAQDGSVSCGSDADSGGTVTSIATGAGLTGGPITGTGTIAVAAGGIGTSQINASQVQRRVTGSCPSGQYVRVVNQDGSVDCGTDATGTPGWGLTGNAGTDPATNFLGTADGQPLELRTANARSLRIEPSSITFGSPALPITSNMIGGSHANAVTAGARGATIGGGGVPVGDSDPDFSLEAPNRVTDHYGTVGGGYANLAGDDAGTPGSAAYATVAGGRNNAAGGFTSTIGGGQGHVASGGWSTIGGGALNVASGDEATIGGGRSNTASGLRSSVVGGFGHVASGDWSSIGGGFDSSASARFSAVGGGSTNTASGDQSTVGGGLFNVASGLQGTVGGGARNTASGTASTVGGGSLNCAGGFASWAGGNRAKARPGVGSVPLGVGCGEVASSGDADGDEGTFVWADRQNDDFVSSGPNQFLIRADGGFGFNTNTIPNGIEAVLQGRTGPNPNVDLYLKPAAHGRGINLAMLPGAGAAAFYISQYDGTSFVDRILLTPNGDFSVTAQAFKPGGGSWAVPSDARLKTQVAPLAGALDLLLTLRGVEYVYRPEATPKSMYLPGRQVGFIAQEVEQVFPDWVSETDAGYKIVGPRGFEALTIEALRELRAESAGIDGGQSTRIMALEADNAALRADLARRDAEHRVVHQRLAAELAELRSLLRASVEQR